MLAWVSSCSNMRFHQYNTMIVSQNKANVVTNGIKGAVSFGIKNDGLAHIFNVLRNQLYSDKILAILREYSCNAVDAHVENGCGSRPIEVSLPNRLELSLKIRDFGAGLSESDIQEIYAFYGESTKRQSNSLIGQLGLGSKSAFSYGDNFVINSFHNGTKTTYNAYIDPSQIGQIAKLSSVPTSEENGVEIVIPVKPFDVDTFTEKAKQVFKYFAVKPIIKGVAPIDFGIKDFILQGADWRIVNNRNTGVYGHTNKSMAIMGNIGYQINPSSLKLDENVSDDSICQKFMSNSNLEFEVKFNIGDLDIAASREGLQYTDKTIKAIKSKFVSIHNELVNKVSKEMDSAPSEFAFKKMIGNMSDITSPYYFVSKALKNLKWKNKSINSNAFTFPNPSCAVRYTPKRGYVGGSYIVKGGDLHGDMDSRTIHLNDNEIFIENTRNLRSCLINYAFNFLKDWKSVTILTFTDKAQRNNYLQKNGLVDSDLVDMATLQKVLLPRNTRSRSGNVATAVRSKHTKNVFQLKTGKSSPPSYSSVKSDHWEELNIDLDDKNVKAEYAWVDIERFEVVLSHKVVNQTVTPCSVRSMINNLEAIKKQYPFLQVPKVIGVKMGKTESNAVRTSLKTLKDFVVEQLKNIYAKDNLSEKYWAGELNANFSENNGVLVSCVSNLITESIAPNTFSIITELNKAFKMSSTETIIINSTKDIKRLLDISDNQIYQVRSKTLDNLAVKLDKLEQTLPLLKIVDRYEFQAYRSKNDLAKKASVDYVRTRDFMLHGVA